MLRSLGYFIILMHDYMMMGPQCMITLFEVLVTDLYEDLDLWQL